MLSSDGEPALSKAVFRLTLPAAFCRVKPWFGQVLPLGLMATIVSSQKNPTKRREMKLSVMREWFVKYKVHLLCGLGAVVYCLLWFFAPLDRYYQISPIARKIRLGMSMSEIQNMIPERFDPRIEMSDSVDPRANVIPDKRKDVHCHLSGSPFRIFIVDAHGNSQDIL